MNAIAEALEPHRSIEVLTTEGIPIRFETAPLGSRVGAFLLDMVLVWLILLGGVLCLALLGVFSGDMGWGVALVLLMAFCLRHFWFTAHELRSNGRTPGKRRAQLRVIDAYGGALSTQAVIARNAMRVVELDLALMALAQPELFFGAVPAGLRWLGVLWILFFSALPLLNPRRLRLGDYVAGTLVVREPAVRLLPDVSQASVPPADADAFSFSEQQLGVYGVYELQVLEELLRRPSGVETSSARRAVAERIQRKIRWSGNVAPAQAEPFLRAFYAALRAHQEQRLLFGRRKRDKHSRDS